MRVLYLSIFCFATLLLLFFSSPLNFAVVLNKPEGKLGFCGEEDNQVIQMASTLGGIHDAPSSHNTTSPEIESLAQFAVHEHNKKENALFELVRVVKTREQVVAGTLHHLTIEVIDAGKKKLYEAKVWVKPWMNFKELQEFRHVEDVPCFTSSDLGVKKDEQVSGWRSVPVHDPVVQEAAHHAIKTIQGRSNSLFPYELREIVHANADVEDASAKFDMLLKVERGGKEEKFKVEVHRNSEGEFESCYERGRNTCEHIQLAKTLGVSKLLVAVNKMDDPTVNWSKERYDEIE